MHGKGFTLVEVVVATALAALLMLAVLGATRSLTRAQADLLQNDRLKDRHPELVALIRFDLVHAQEVKLAKNRLVLEGFGALDPQTLSPVHRPARITYRLQQGSPGQAGSAGLKDSWLVREQVMLDEPGSTIPWIELVASKVAQFDTTSAIQQSPSASGDRPKSPALSGLPSAVQLTLNWSDNKKPLEATLILR